MSLDPPPKPGLSPLARPQRPRHKRRVPLGQPIRWTDEQLDALSAISPADLAAAEALWQRAAPGSLKDLLAAQVMEHEETR